MALRCFFFSFWEFEAGHTLRVGKRSLSNKTGKNGQSTDRADLQKAKAVREEQNNSIVKKKSRGEENWWRSSSTSQITSAKARTGLQAMATLEPVVFPISTGSSWQLQGDGRKGKRAPGPRPKLLSSNRHDSVEEAFWRGEIVFNDREHSERERPHSHAYSNDEEERRGTRLSHLGSLPLSQWCNSRSKTSGCSTQSRRKGNDRMKVFPSS